MRRRIKFIVNDLSGHVVKRSDDLPAETTEWRVTQGLKRGEVYAWTVVAVIDSKEVVSPGPAAPEMKFHVLSMQSLQQLTTLKKTQFTSRSRSFLCKRWSNCGGATRVSGISRLNSKSKLASKLLKAVSSTDSYQ